MKYELHIYWSKAPQKLFCNQLGLDEYQLSHVQLVGDKTDVIIV